jgi:heparosan-N-sulfate-glucuronate 5-epimerase
MKGKITDIFYMARDFFRIILGVDYFHQPEKLGDFFQDRKAYYIDFKSKTEWKGRCKDDVPVLYVPSMEKDIFFPAMIIQYGLGSIDKYFRTADEKYLENIKNVYRWIVKNLNSRNYFDNMTSELDNNFPYYSNNSALTQGQAISFLARAKEHNLISSVSDEAESLMKRIFSNMVLPLEEGGTSLKKGKDFFFCEYCRKDEYIVLNGWVFALFGLLDYQSYFKDELSQKYLKETIDTLKGKLGEFMMDKERWSYYDNKKRACSHIYEDLHIHMADALYRLTKENFFSEIFNKLKKGNTFANRVKYIIIKIRDKFKDSYRYTTN